MTRQSSHDSSSRAREFCQLGTDIYAFRQARIPFQNSQSRDSRNRPSAKNQPRVRDFGQPVFGARQPKRASKRNPGRRSRTRPNAPAPGRDASEVSTSTPSGVQPHVLTKTTMSNALAAPAARATTPATVRTLTRLIFLPDAAFRPATGARGAHPRASRAGLDRPARPSRRIVPHVMPRPRAVFRPKSARATRGARLDGLLPRRRFDATSRIIIEPFPRPPVSRTTPLTPAPPRKRRCIVPARSDWSR